MNNNLNFKIFKHFEKKLEEDWKELENKGDFYFFQKYDHIKNFAKVFNVNYFLIVIYNNKKPIGIFPLEIKIQKKIRFLQWLGSNHFDYCCPIINDSQFLRDQDFISIWKKILKSIDEFDVILLHKQPEYIEKTFNPFVKFLKNSYHSKIYQINLSNTGSDYIFNIKNKKFTSEFKRTKKKLLENNNFKFEINTKYEQSKLIEKIIIKKISTLKLKNKSHLLNEKFIKFYKILNQLMPDKVVLGKIEINSELVAANIGILENKRFYYFLPVIFSEKFKSFSPGKILIHELIKWCQKNEIKTFDFGLGEEIYKKYWSNQSVRVFSHFSYKGIRGLFIFFVLKVIYFFKSISKKL